MVLPDVEPMPGVVAGWRRNDGGGWAARVAYALGDKTGGVVTGWLPTSVLRAYEATAAATDERAGAQAKKETPRA